MKRDSCVGSENLHFRRTEMQELHRNTEISFALSRGTSDQADRQFKDKAKSCNRQRNKKTTNKLSNRFKEKNKWAINTDRRKQTKKTKEIG